MHNGAMLAVFTTLLIQNLHQPTSSDLQILFKVIMGSMQDVDKMNAYLSGHICLSVRMIYPNRWMDFDKT
jgi:hypothetical protein